MEKYYNLIIIGFVIGLIVVSIFWAFNTVRRIEIQRNFCAVSLTSIAKLWRRANFVPENARERESLYLYRDFLRKFDEEDCKYPIVVRNGGVRVMTRKEYDDACGQKTVKCFSRLTLLASLLVAVVALYVNMTITKMVWFGVGLALILPIEQLILFFFLSRFDKEKNIYRDGIFLALKENSTNFLSITKPFILVDAYPKKFGKKAKPIYRVKGDLPKEQMEEVRDFIIQQKKAESKVELRRVDNEKEIAKMENPELVDDEEQITEPTVSKNVAEQVPAETNVEPVNNESVTEINVEPAASESVNAEPVEPNDDYELTAEEKDAIVTKLIDDMLRAEVEREIAKAKGEVPAEEMQPIMENNAEPVIEEAEPAPANVTEPAPEPELTTVENPPFVSAEDVPAPAEDDFSLEAIGQALDAEIAKRNKKK